MSRSYDVISAYALKRGDQFLRMGSYRVVTSVDNPLKASLYSRLSDANKRLEYPGDFYMNDERVPARELRIVEVSVLHWEEADV
jgi:hypothetical protein